MHHHRRKSGHGSANTSYTDVRKAVTVTDLSTRHNKSSRPAMARKTTPQVSHKLGKNPRDREREMEDEYWLSDERESFPQFWYVSPTSPLFCNCVCPCAKAASLGFTACCILRLRLGLTTASFVRLNELSLIVPERQYDLRKTIHAAGRKVHLLF